MHKIVCLAQGVGDLLFKLFDLTNHLVIFVSMIKRVYIDTSVFGGQFDKEFFEDTIPFFNAVSKGKFIVIISDLLEAEPVVLIASLQKLTY